MAKIRICSSPTTLKGWMIIDQGLDAILSATTLNTDMQPKVLSPKLTNWDTDSLPAEQFRYSLFSLLPCSPNTSDHPNGRIAISSLRTMSLMKQMLHPQRMGYIQRTLDQGDPTPSAFFSGDEFPHLQSDLEKLFHTAEEDVKDGRNCRGGTKKKQLQRMRKC